MKRNETEQKLQVEVNIAMNLFFYNKEVKLSEFRIKEFKYYKFKDIHKKRKGVKNNVKSYR